MILAYIVLIPLLIICLWVFFKSSPKETNSNKIKIYNFSTLLSVVLLCTVYTLKLRFDMIGGSDFGWWPVLSFIFLLAISSLLLFISGLVRNFIIFRRRTK